MDKGSHELSACCPWECSMKEGGLVSGLQEKHPDESIARQMTETGDKNWNAGVKEFLRK